MEKKEFLIQDKGDGKEFGVYSMKDYSKGELIAVVSGEIVDEPRLHTLQVAPDKHLYDPEFTGLLLHSCSPNAVINPGTLKMWCKKDIAVGEAITVDYRNTEDKIVKQFACSCGAPNCRNWIIGRTEKINKEGMDYLSKLSPEVPQKKPEFGVEFRSQGPRWKNFGRR